MIITKDWIYHSYMIFYFLALSSGKFVCLKFFIISSYLEVHIFVACVISLFFTPFSRFSS